MTLMSPTCVFNTCVNTLFQFSLKFSFLSSCFPSVSRKKLRHLGRKQNAGFTTLPPSPRVFLLDFLLVVPVIGSKGRNELCDSQRLHLFQPNSKGWKQNSIATVTAH